MKNKLIIIILGSISLYSCTDNERSKNFGGTMQIKLKEDQKLVNLTWKEDQLWVLTRKMKPNEEPDSYEFKEKSSYGVIEGKINIYESKSVNDISNLHENPTWVK